ncbi:MAG: hypothetical protein KAI53_00355 [Candidatus Aenigmarchaeota archaeon]|nr:hypothetical protein [Candidatus Aenigmarchaeota archaeon]
MGDLHLLKTEVPRLGQFLKELKLLKNVADKNNANVIVTAAIQYGISGKNKQDTNYSYSVEFKAKINYDLPDSYKNNISGKLQKIRDWHKTKQSEMRYITQEQVYESYVGEATTSLRPGKKEKLIAALEDAKTVVNAVNHEELTVLSGASEFDCLQVYNSIKETVL